MLNRLLLKVRRPNKRLSKGESVKPPMAAGNAKLAPMQPLLPPPAGNDDLTGAILEEVRRELRRAGYLGS